MSGRFLLDTNVVIAILNREPALTDRLQDAIVFLSSIVLGELYFGARKSARVAENLARIEALVADYPLLDCNADTAPHYGQIKHQLQVKGRPIPENDIWIAALAQQHDLTIVTHDEHFREVSGLSLEAW